ncbi:tRNA uridine-5-carboxymethylaminomethyl(34) synthesis GTPase MnmE [Veillonella sp. R32]|uniref:tRNA uridine-5-carboxymethylaminomethyl(34) synthesis GTPase MnmE n=1 Tax=Veillonella sp. R32 TaxID=2021312 RepID=UPI001389E277|nr:tRNA uridine-5-carboxymethylaminomethyl(34) synthesis GTPase MnmE [Veillonella sp. R32]KAF1680709.1 tRNA uridine-5-carboxymethylaminomethyl(34) synthesis GTPase MnmE [Veillonella sp. R32]
MYTEDTIAAIATPPGIGGVGIIRVSGTRCFEIVSTLFQAKGTVPLEKRPNRTIQYGHIIDPQKDNEVLDEVLLLIMRGPQSFTAEDVIEIQCHGGIVVVREILKVLLCQGARLAEPGEFTKRAFLNGRIDLTQAEAIIDIIEAKSEQSLSVAVKQLDGTLAQLIRTIREDLIALIAHLEVAIDYPEEDIEELTMDETAAKLRPILAQIDNLLATANRGRLLRDGIITAIVGRPNAGKSSLMNALLRENRAIVTDVPGTTRDSIEEAITIEGIPVRLIDTAGIRETEDIVEKIGVDRAKEYLESAQIVICVIDASKPLTADEEAMLRHTSGKNTIVFLNKADKGSVVTEAMVNTYGTFTVVATISAAKGEGMEVLAKAVKELVYGGTVQNESTALLSNVRHITLMEQAKSQLHTSLETIEAGLPVDFVVTDMREAWERLGDITGDSLRESMVDELFSRFCLGK